MFLAYSCCFLLSHVLFCVSFSAPGQNGEATQAGTGQKTGKESAPSRRREEAKQAVKKPKEKENALSQFDLNNYASECLRLFEGICTLEACLQLTL